MPGFGIEALPKYVRIIQIRGLIYPGLAVGVAAAACKQHAHVVETNIAYRSVQSLSGYLSYLPGGGSGSFSAIQ